MHSGGQVGRHYHYSNRVGAVYRISTLEISWGKKVAYIYIISVCTIMTIMAIMARMRPPKKHVGEMRN